MIGQHVRTHDLSVSMGVLELHFSMHSHIRTRVHVEASTWRQNWHGCGVGLLRATATHHFVVVSSCEEHLCSSPPLQQAATCSLDSQTCFLYQ